MTELTIILITAGVILVICSAALLVERYKHRIPAPLESAPNTPMVMLARRIARDEDALRPCNRNLRRADYPTCDNLITYRESGAAGHRGFCSREHADETENNSPM